MSEQTPNASNRASLVRYTVPDTARAIVEISVGNHHVGLDGMMIRSRLMRQRNVRGESANSHYTVLIRRW